MPKAMPLFRTWVIDRNGSTSRLSPSAMLSMIRCFVTWSATTATAATETIPTH
jgi:hypothetical protein